MYNYRKIQIYKSRSVSLSKLVKLQGREIASLRTRASLLVRDLRSFCFGQPFLFYISFIFLGDHASKKPAEKQAQRKAATEVALQRIM